MPVVSSAIGLLLAFAAQAEAPAAPHVQSRPLPVPPPGRLGDWDTKPNGGIQTQNEAGEILSVLCDEEGCNLMIHRKIGCDRGGDYPVEVHTDKGSFIDKLICLHEYPEVENPRQAFLSIQAAPYVDAMRQGGTLSFSFAPEAGQPVSSFSLSGAYDALKWAFKNILLEKKEKSGAPE